MTNSLSKAAAEMGKKGGSSKSEAKTRASRKNGQKGGRPKKCSYCDEGARRVRELLPNGELIWAHWVNHVCHECKAPQ